MSDTTIDDILDDMTHPSRQITTNEHRSIARQQAKSALYDLILKEVVGNQGLAIPYDTDHKVELDWVVTHMNEQTNKLKGLFDA